MVAGEAGTDGFVDFEPARRGQHDNTWGFEGIIGVKIKNTMIKTSLIGFVKTMEAEVELEGVFSCDQHVRYRFLIEFLGFFLKAKECKFRHNIYKITNRR